jgi:hypothetical protein
MAGPLAFLPYALAAYGGYKSYKASKDAGVSGIGRLLDTAVGAATGYYGGKGVLAGGSALNIPSFASAQQNFTPFLTQFPALDVLNLGQASKANPEFLGTDKFGNLIRNPDFKVPNVNQDQGGGITKIFDKALRRKRFVDGVDTGEMEFSPGKVAAAIAAGTYFGGAFDPKPIDVYTPTYNLGVAELQKQRGGFKYIDPVSGEEKTFEQVYIPEANRDPQFTVGNIELSKNTFNTGGLASIPKYNEGGVNYLPSKVTHDENDSNNYVRAQGYVEDGSGTGDKDEDTMLAQLADGEFVTRADGVLGAGIIAGANPNSFKDMREKGASYFYEQQKRYKRVFDLLKGSRDAKAKVN